MAHQLDWALQDGRKPARGAGCEQLWDLFLFQSCNCPYDGHSALVSCWHHMRRTLRVSQQKSAQIVGTACTARAPIHRQPLPAAPRHPGHPLVQLVQPPVHF